MNTKQKYVVFISLPMSGKSNREIRSEIQAAKKWYLCSNRKKLDIYDVAFVTNLGAEYQLALYVNASFDDLTGTFGDKDQDSIWMLGAALQKMAECDEVLFWGQWGKARGCLIEHEVAKKYKLPITYGTDWSEEINEALKAINPESNRNSAADKYKKGQNEWAAYWGNDRDWLIGSVYTFKSFHNLIYDLLNGDDLK